MIRQQRSMRIVIIIACLLVLGSGGYLAWSIQQPRYSDVQDVVSQSGLALVLPNPLPHNAVIVDQPTYDGERRTIVTRLKIGDSSVTLSQQPKPHADLKQIDAEDTFLVDAGSVYILKGEIGRYQAIIETADSWLMVNAEKGLGASTFKALLNSLKAT